MAEIVGVLFPSGRGLLVLLEAILTLAAFVAAVYIDLGVDPTVFLIYDFGLAKILIVVLTIQVALRLSGTYAATPRMVLFQQLCLVLGIAFLVQGLISYLSPGFRVPIRVMMLGSPIAGLALFGLRLAAKALGVSNQ